LQKNTPVYLMLFQVLLTNRFTTLGDLERLGENRPGQIPFFSGLALEMELKV